MELYLAALVGALIYGLMDFVSATGKGVFTWKYLIAIAVNMLAGAFVIWLLELKPNQFMLSNFDFTRVVAAFIGISGMKVFKMLIKIADKNIKTRFGANKK